MLVSKLFFLFLTISAISTDIKLPREQSKELLEKTQDPENIPLSSKPLEKIELENEPEALPFHSKEAIEYAYSRVKKYLSSNVKEKDFPDFYDRDFATRLYAILSNNKEIVENNLYFGDDLKELLFKWMIHMRQETALKDKEFEMISSEITLFESIIGDLILNNFKITKELNYQFSNKLGTEFIENHSHLFPQFARIVEFFYISKNKDSDCLRLKRLFPNRNYNSNILLKYMIVMFDPQGKLRECIIKDDPDSSELEASPKIEVTPNYLEDLKSRGPENLEIPYKSYMNTFTLKSLVQINKKFEINDSLDVIMTLGNLERASKEEELSRELVTGIIGFKSSDPKNKSLEWNQRRFESLINDWLWNNKNPDNHLICAKYLKLFNSFGELYDRVINRLKIKDSFFYFDIQSFAFTLYGHLNSQMDSIPDNDSFWYDLQRLLFTWLIRRKQNNNQKEFENILKSVKVFIPILKGKNINLDFSFELDPIRMKKRDELDTFKELINCELVENIEKLETFALILERYYYKSKKESKDSKNENESICDKLKMEYFYNDFKKDQLLKFAIIFHDPIGKLREECFPKEVDSIMRSSDIEKEKNKQVWTVESLPKYIKALKNLSEPSDLTISNMNHVSGTIMKTFSKYNRKFLVKDHDDLGILLSKMRKEFKESNELTERLVTNLIDFECDEKNKEKLQDYSAWMTKFKELLEMAKGKLANDDYEFYKGIFAD